MPILDPYETSYGKLINKSRLVKEIRDYVLKSGEKLNYEYESGSDATLAFITGYSKEEQELSLFEHPLLFKDIKDKDVIAVDMRKFLRESKEKPLKLSELVKDGAGFDFNL